MTRFCAYTLLLLLVFTSCNTKPAALTGDDISAIEAVLTARVDEIVLGTQQLDLDAAMAPYWDSEDFILINPDGTHIGYMEMKSINGKLFQELDSLTFVTEGHDIRVLSDKEALYTWFGNNRMVFKTGEAIQIERYAGSMLFRMIDGEWKIVYAHESASEPLSTPPADEPEGDPV